MKNKKSAIITFVALLCALLMLASCSVSSGNTVSQDGDTSKPSNETSGSNPELVCKHEIEIDPATAPTCNEQGKTEGSHCSKCGIVLEAQIKSPAKGHTYNGNSCTICGYTPSEGLVYKKATIWTEDNVRIDGYSVSIGSCTEKDIKIADVYNGEPVIAIAQNGFSNSTIESVDIPYSVMLIGKEAFCENEDLETVTLGYGVKTVQSGAFWLSDVENICISDLEAWCKIEYTNGADGFQKLYLNGTLVENLTIPGSITDIRYDAFHGIGSLVSVTIPDSVVTIGKNAFSSCKNLKNITFGNGVETICASAFTDCESLTSIKIPDNVTTIEDLAFYDCGKLKTIALSKRINKIGEGVFSGTEYYCTESNWENAALYIGEYLIKVNAKEGGEDYSEDYWIKEGTVLIADKAFDECYVSKITIPSSVKYIGNEAFYYCKKLKEISIPSSVLNVGSRILIGCEKLEKLSVPLRVEEKESSISVIQYFYTSGGKTKTIPETLKTITIVGNEIPNYSFGDCDYVKDVIISESVTEVGSEIFSSCYKLTDVWCEASQKPEGWSDTWSESTSAMIHWGDEWHYVDGVPTLK